MTLRYSGGVSVYDARTSAFSVTQNSETGDFTVAVSGGLTFSPISARVFNIEESALGPNVVQIAVARSNAAAQGPIGLFDWTLATAPAGAGSRAAFIALVKELWGTVGTGANAWNPSQGRNLLMLRRAATTTLDVAGAGVTGVSGTDFGLEWDTADLDDAGLWSAGTPARITAPEPGTFFVHCDTGDVQGVGGRLFGRWFKNGNAGVSAEGYAHMTVEPTAAAPTGTAASGSCIIRADAAGDWIAWRIVQGNATILSIGSTGNFAEMPKCQIQFVPDS